MHSDGNKFIKLFLWHKIEQICVIHTYHSIWHIYLHSTFFTQCLYSIFSFKVKYLLVWNILNDSAFRECYQMSSARVGLFWFLFWLWPPFFSAPILPQLCMFLIASKECTPASLISSHQTIPLTQKYVQWIGVAQYARQGFPSLNEETRCTRYGGIWILTSSNIS